MTTPSASRARALWIRVRPWVPVLVYLAFTLLVWWRLWTPIDGARGSWRYDPRYEYWGDLVFQYETLADGHLAVWNPYDRAGFPVYGDPQPGLLYPPNWLIWLWGALAGGVPYDGITAKIILHWVFGAVGMHLFLRRLGAREPACYVGGALFGWTCPKIRMGGSALNWSLAWIPWVLLALHWFAERPDWKRGTVLGSAAAMVLLCGAPAMVLYLLVLAVPYGLWLLRGRLRAALGPIAVSAAVAILWLLPLVASNLEQLPESVREKRDLAFITDTVFTPASFGSVILPRLGGEPIYYGLLTMLGVGLALAAPGRGRALLFGLVALAGAALALGMHAGVLPSMASAAPPFGLFRRAHRFLYITSVAIAIVAPLGLSYAMSLAAEDTRQRLARWILGIGGAITFAVGIGYLIALTAPSKGAALDADQLGWALASCAAATFLVRAVLVARGRMRAVYHWLIPAAVALDLWSANAKLIDVFTPPPVLDKDVRVAELADVEREWRVYDRGYLDLRPGTRLGIRDFGGYEDDPLGLSRYKTLLNAARGNLELLGHANVRYYLDGGRRPPLKPRPDQKLTALPGFAGKVYELQNVAPAVMYVPDAKVVDSPAAALRALRAITPGQGAVVEGPPPPPAPGGAPIASGRITRLEPNRVTAEIETPGPGLVVIAEAYFPAWEATVDGEPVTIQPANLLMRGVPVDAAGRHVIDMRIQPLRFWGLLPAYLTAMGLLGWVVIGDAARRRWARRRGAPSPRSSTPPSADPPTEAGSA